MNPFKCHAGLCSNMNYVRFLGESHVHFKIPKGVRDPAKAPHSHFTDRKAETPRGDVPESSCCFSEPGFEPRLLENHAIIFLGLLQTTCCQILDQTLHLKFFLKLQHTSFIHGKTQPV